MKTNKDKNDLIQLSNGDKISLEELIVKYERQQEVLEGQSKLASMGEMLPMIVHQWQQPLQTISILSQKLLLCKSESEMLEKTVDNISKQLEYMSKTIGDFRNYFMPGKTKRFILCSKLSTKALNFLSNMLKIDEINVKNKIIKDKEVYLCPNEITHIIINIIRNARDAMVERKVKNKEIVISYDHDDNFVSLKIEDNAGGIPEEILDKMFTVYFTTKKSGTGFGLYMSKKIIEENYHGSINVENGKRGAIFTIKLPISGE